MIFQIYRPYLFVKNEVLKGKGRRVKTENNAIWVDLLHCADFTPVEQGRVANINGSTMKHGLFHVVTSLENAVKIIIFYVNQVKPRHENQTAHRLVAIWFKSSSVKFFQSYQGFQISPNLPDII